MLKFDFSDCFDGTHDNSHAYTTEHEDFPEEPRDFVAFAMPEYKEDRRNLFAGLHSALGLFALACDVVSIHTMD
jgi:hypothetical protein